MKIGIATVTRATAAGALIACSTALAQPPRLALMPEHTPAIAPAQDLAHIGRAVFSPLDAVPLYNGPDVGHVRSWHMTDIDEDALFGSEARQRQNAGEPITLDLRGDGEFLPLLRVPLDFSLGEAESWYGEFPGKPGAYALFVRHDGVISGKVLIPNEGLFEILEAGNGAYIVRELDDEALPPCGNTAAHRVAAPPHEQLDEAALAASSPDRGTFIFVDVLLLYTANARLGAGGTANIESQLNLAIADANLAYASSGITMRIRAAAMIEVVYTESNSLSTDLGRLANASDGHIDNAHTLRNEYSADMVQLITAAAAGGACGVGYLMTFVSPSFQSSAFSVTARTCLSNQTLAHELGHNQGCAHDRDNSGSPGAFPYSYGHRDAAAAYRTIMAYAPGQRVKLFSNPNVNFPNGQPSGVPVESPLSAYNALSLELAAPTVANWRQLFVTPPGPFDLLTPAPGVTPSRNVTFTWSAAPETDYYRIMVDDDADFSSPVIDFQPITMLTYATPHNSLDLGKEYFWKVVAINPLGSSASTPASQSFMTPAVAPSAFALNLPANGATGISTKPLFQWQASDNCDNYTLTVDDDADFSSPVIHVTGIVNPNYSAALTPLQPETVYYWKVSSTNSYGSTDSSPLSSSFTTIGLPPEAFALLSPPDGPNVTTTTPTLTWSESLYADSYELLVDDSPAFTTPEYHATEIASTSHEIPPGHLVSGVRYYWRVISSNSVGTKVCSPATFSFGVLLPYCFGDADRSFVVNFDDISCILANWGGAGPIGDANNSGSVDFGDITTVISNWGAECPQ